MPIVDSRYDRGQLFNPLSLNGSMPHHFIVDTGAGISAIDAQLACDLQLPTIAHTELAGTGGLLTMWRALWDRHPEYRVHHQLEANGIGGPVELDVGRISRFDLGPHFGEISVVIQPSSGISASPDAIGFVALNLFERDQWLTFDFPSGRLYL